MISAKTIKKTALAPTVLISHGGGFLTGHLAETLLLKNCRVVVLSNFKEHKDPQLHSLLKSPKFALFDCDINQELPDAVESVDYIFHLANYDSFLDADGAPQLESLLSASVGTKNLLDLAKKSQAKFALICPLVSESSAKKKNDISLEEAQKYSRTLVLEYRERWSLDTRFVYVGRVYGPRMSLLQSGELGALLKNVIAVKPLDVYGDGARKEYYLYYSDAVNGLVKSLFSQSQKGSFTLIEEKPHTTLEVAYILKSLANGRADINFLETDGAYKKLQNTEISYPPLWQPKVELKDGLAKTLKSLGYRSNSKAFKAGVLIDEKNLQKMRSTSLETTMDLRTINTPKKKEAKISAVKLFLYHCEGRLRRVKGSLKVDLSNQRFKQLKIVGFGVLGLFILGAVFLGIPLLQSYSHAKSALNDLENYQISISRLDSQESQKLSENAYNHLSRLEKSLSRTAPIFILTGKTKTHESLLAFVQSSKNFSSALYSISLGAEPFADLWNSLKPNSAINLNAQEFGESAGYFKDAKQKLDFAQATLGNVDKKYLPDNMQVDFENYKLALENIDKNGDALTQLALEFPRIVGLNGQRRYLILFQNNNELRPTGGFLGSYAVVELTDGKISKIDIDDIYNPDGQLKLSGANANVKSPVSVAKALNEESLYIRNANWHPSFPTSSRVVNDLFKLVDSRGFDGVFAVDLYFVRDLLTVTGPLYLTAYDEEIRVDNMYERAQLHSDFDFRDGVSSKKAFITVLGGKMLEKLFSLPQEKVPSLMGVLYSSLEQKHLLVDLQGTYISQYLAERSWDGALLDTQGDYLYVVNANLGGTKSNYYVKNSMNYAVSSKTSDGLLRSELELSYQNTQKDASWPGGPYKNYVRVLVQDGSKLTGAFLMTSEVVGLQGQNVDVMGAANGINIMDQVVIAKVGNYTSFEYLITVNPQEKVSLLFNYDLPVQFSAKKDTNKYSLVWQKQPGTQNDAVRLMFAAPFGTQILQAVPVGTISENIYEYKGVLNSNLQTAIFYR